jgi:hypothetical protein
VELEGSLEERLPEAAELTAYLVVYEALMGLPEGAEATVRAVIENGTLTVEVRGAAVAGDRLERLRERVEALDGSIEAGGDSVRTLLPAGR